jgi:two-component system sensor histidine kinase KdpD
MEADLLALYVEIPQKLNESQKEQLTKNINLAKHMGAEYVTTSGNDLVKAILTVAHKENITHIIIGKPRHRNLLSLLMLGNFVQKLIRNSGNIDVYVLGSDLPSDSKYLKYISFPTYTSHISQYILSGIIIGLTALVCSPMSGETGYQVVSFILLFVVSILATFMGIGPILLASTMSALVWNYFFIPPRFNFHIDKTEDALMFGMFFFIALVNGVLTSRVRKQERLARDREERTNALFQLTKELSKASGIDEVLSIAIKDIKKHFSLDSIFVLQDGNNKLIPSGRLLKEEKPSQNEYGVADWVFKHSKKAGKFTDTLPSGDYTYYPLNGTRLKPGVVAIKLNKPFSGDKDTFWDTFLTQLSNALER